MFKDKTGLSFCFGRSMTEMLGVLAIIGVLSIGVLVGLKYAFMKHQSNLIIEDVKLAGFIVKDGLFETLPMTEEKSLSGYFTPQTSYPFTTFKETDTSYAVVIDGVAENLCLDLKKRKVEWLEEIRANGQENACREGDVNSMSFFFNESLNTELTGCQNDTECGECGRCENRKCVYDAGEVVSGDKCVSCGSLTVGISGATLSSCQQCNNRVYLGISEQGGNCFLCSHAATFANTRKSDCMTCGNRYWIETSNDFGVCFYCDGTVSADGTACEWNCPAGQVGGDNGCFDCDSSTLVFSHSTLSSCRQCNNRVYVGTSETSGNCYLCSYAGTFANTRKSDCMTCGNRYWIGTSNDFGVCFYCDGTVTADGTGCEWNCPAGQVGSDNACISCDSSTKYANHTSLSSCHQCSNRVYSGADSVGGTCFVCSATDTLSEVRKEDCVACGNRYWTDRGNGRGICRLCNGTVSADGTTCE